MSVHYADLQYELAAEYDQELQIVGSGKIELDGEELDRAKFNALLRRAADLDEAVEELQYNLDRYRA